MPIFCLGFFASLRFQCSLQGNSACLQDPQFCPQHPQFSFVILLSKALPEFLPTKFIANLEVPAFQRCTARTHKHTHTHTHTHTKFYHERVLGELGIAPGGPNTGNSTYKVCPKSINDVVESHVEFYKGFNMTHPDKSKRTPYIHWLPKLHKTHMETVSSLLPADVPPHWFRKYLLHAWA